MKKKTNETKKVNTEKKEKSFLLFPKNSNEVVDGKVNGLELLGTVKKFGKEYFRVKKA